MTPERTVLPSPPARDAQLPPLGASGGVRLETKPGFQAHNGVLRDTRRWADPFCSTGAAVIDEIPEATMRLKLPGEHLMAGDFNRHNSELQIRMACQNRFSYPDTPETRHVAPT